MQVSTPEMPPSTLTQASILQSLKSTIPKLLLLRQTQPKTTHSYKPNYYDIGLNITDPMFSGSYRDSQHHRNDINEVLLRAKLFNVEKALVTGSSVEESRNSIEIAKFYNGLNELYKAEVLKDMNATELVSDDDDDVVVVVEQATEQFHRKLQLSEQSVYQPYPVLKTTAGVHPCTVLEFESNPEVTPEEHLDELRKLITSNLDIIQAFGEIGLDYDRLHYTPKEKQLFYFELQLKLACEFNLPLFLHMRNAFDDFISILKPFVEGTRKDGLVLQNKKLCIHSFTGTPEDMTHLLEAFNGDGVHIAKSWISFNGCSLREEMGLDVAKLIPTDRLLIETDSPWCEVKRTSAGYGYLKKCPNAFYPFDYVTDLTSLVPVEPIEPEENTLQEDQKKPLDSTLNGKQQNPRKQKQKQLPKKDSTQFNEYLPIPIVKSKKLDEFILNSNNKRTYLPPLIKSRNEPCLIGQVGQIISGVKGIDEQELIEACWKNSLEVFG